MTSLSLLTTSRRLGMVQAQARDYEELLKDLVSRVSADDAQLIRKSLREVSVGEIGWKVRTLT
jgi:hypothetical protein